MLLSWYLAYVLQRLTWTNMYWCSSSLCASKKWATTAYMTCPASQQVCSQRVGSMIFAIYLPSHRITIISFLISLSFNHPIVFQNNSYPESNCVVHINKLVECKAWETDDHGDFISKEQWQQQLLFHLVYKCLMVKARLVLSIHVSMCKNKNWQHQDHAYNSHSQTRLEKDLNLSVAHANKSTWSSSAPCTCKNLL